MDTRTRRNIWIRQYNKSVFKQVVSTKNWNTIYAITPLLRIFLTSKGFLDNYLNFNVDTTVNIVHCVFIDVKIEELYLVSSPVA